jgi:hypothetical protein
MAYLRHDSEAGGGMAAAHATNSKRIQQLLPFTASASYLTRLSR